MAPQPSLPPRHCSLQSVAKPMSLACHKPALVGEMEVLALWQRHLSGADAGDGALNGMGLGDPRQLGSSLGLCQCSASAEPQAVSTQLPWEIALLQHRNSDVTFLLPFRSRPSFLRPPSPLPGSRSRPLLNKGPVAMVNNPHIKALQKRRGRRAETQRSRWELSRGRGVEEGVFLSCRTGVSKKAPSGTQRERGGTPRQLCPHGTSDTPSLAVFYPGNGEQEVRQPRQAPVLTPDRSVLCEP